MSFNPFENRSCRDLRNQLGHAFIQAMESGCPEDFLAPARRCLEKNASPDARHYIRYRMTCLSTVLDQTSRRPPGEEQQLKPFALLWELDLFFECHEWLEKKWVIACGSEKKALHALILSAVAFEHRLYHRWIPAEKISLKAAKQLKRCKSRIPETIPVDRLIFELENPPAAVLIIQNAVTRTVFVDRITLFSGHCLCLCGTNRSGILDLFQVMTGQMAPVSADILTLPSNPGVISFKHQQEIYEAELKNDDTDFLDQLDPGTPARNFLPAAALNSTLISAFDMTHCLDKGFRQLSTGQARKLLLLSHLIRGTDCLMLQAPFDGLDNASRNELDQTLYHLHRKNIGLILFVHNTCDIPEWCTLAGVVADHALHHLGPPGQVLPAITAVMKTALPDFQASAADLSPADDHRFEPGRIPALIHLKNASAGYNGQHIFTNMTLLVHEGEHTLVTGPNGCGKSTLLQMITGDHPACYQNDLMVMGTQRGSGESIWDIKKQMGIVSADLHRNYRAPGSTLACVLSGLFDSIGLYRACSRQQELLARQWLTRIGLETKHAVPFQELSYANQRLVLIARALIKVPRLLILDEPTQGLDEINRNAVLDFLEAVARMKCSTFLYVSHRQDEFRSFFCQHIQMAPAQ